MCTDYIITSRALPNAEIFPVAFNTSIVLSIAALTVYIYYWQASAYACTGNLMRQAFLAHEGKDTPSLASSQLILAELLLK